MKRIIFILITVCSIIILIIVYNCYKSINVSSKFKTEIFSNEFLLNYETIPNIIYDLNINPEVVKTCEEDENHLIFAFHYDDNNGSYTKEYEQYIQKLEDQGFKLTLYDATISQTFELSRYDYFISIKINSVQNEDGKEASDSDNTNELDDNYTFKIIRRN